MGEDARRIYDMGISIALPPLSERVDMLRAIVDELVRAGAEETIAAIVADGWPEKMARLGLEMHARTWDTAGLVDALERELSPFGGLDALEHPRRGLRLVAPSQIVHVWPALPGAGLTPCLFGWLIGSWQIARASSRGRHLARRINDVWLERVGLATLSVEEGPKESWRSADVVIVSGTDETIDAVSEFLGTARSSPHLVRYGHRTSIGVVVDDGSDDALRSAHDFALDAVMWHQQGCFSPRAIVFCGDHTRMRAFSSLLGRQIERIEDELGGRALTEAELARRVQARGVAEFTTQMWGDGMGWVQLATQPHDGAFVSPHVVTMHHVHRLSELPSVFDVPPHELQGAALWTSSDGPQRRAWVDALARQGFTRVCHPGTLQQPPPGWFHDGEPNVLSWMRVCRED